MANRSVRSARSPADLGSALPLVLVCVALAAVLAVGTARLGRATIDAARAQTAADAAALAAVHGGQEAAAALAARNGATLLSVVRDGDDVVVRVAVGGVVRAARATDGP